LASLGVSGEEIRFTGRDGVRLSGTLLSRGRKDPLIIVAHGVGANRYDLMEIGAHLHHHAYDVFLFDFRAHGKSEGRITSFGYREQQDLLGALDYLDQRDDVSKPYGFYGVSMGGAVGILVAAEDTRLMAICVDSPFTDLKGTVEKHLTLLYPLPKFPFFYFATLSYRILFGVPIEQISPLRVAHRLSPRPFYLINGSEDVRMTPERAEALYEKIQGPKRIWLIPNAHIWKEEALPRNSTIVLWSLFLTKPFKGAPTNKEENDEYCRTIENVFCDGFYLQLFGQVFNRTRGGSFTP